MAVGTLHSVQQTDSFRWHVVVFSLLDKWRQVRRQYDADEIVFDIQQFSGIDTVIDLRKI